MAKFTLDDIAGGGSSSSSEPTQIPKSPAVINNGTIVFQDETMRVVQQGKDWFTYVVYNYVDMPREFSEGNRNVRYGLKFSNQREAERGFAKAKQNKTQVIEIAEAKIGLNIKF